MTDNTEAETNKGTHQQLPLFNNSNSTKTKRLSAARFALVGLIAGAVGGSGASYAFMQYEPTGLRSVNQQLLVQENSSVIDVASKVSPSVVSITTSQQSRSFFGQTQQVEGAGTGIIVTDDGLILTNKHVVPEGVTTVTVVDSNGKQYADGKVIARDPANDIAFVKIEASGLPEAELGDSAAVKVGQKVVAIGNALGQFQNSVTEGIISGVSREIEAGGSSSDESETLTNVFQTDAAINSGNSGGPLVNLAGQVIGMNTAVASQDAQNIGFAIPINDIKRDITSVKSDGRIVRPYLGVRFVQLTPAIASANNIETKNGAWLQPNSTESSVVAGSPAAKAGLKDNDIIVTVDGNDITATSSLQTLISQKTVGDKVKLEVIRDSKSISLSVTLDELPSSTR